jgi:hypothetical protein
LTLFWRPYSLTSRADSIIPILNATMFSNGTRTDYAKVRVFFVLGRALSEVLVFVSGW